MDLHDLCALYRYQLIIDPDPQNREDALGNVSQDRIGKAQLCKNNIIAIQENNPNATYCVSHELAHGIMTGDENDILVEQANILSRWVVALIRDIKDYEKERLDKKTGI